MLWDSAVLKKWKGHEQAIRVIKEIPGLGFLTGSNDESVKIWSMDG